MNPNCHGGQCRALGLGLSHIVVLAIGIFIGTRIAKCCDKKKAIDAAKEAVPHDVVHEE